MNWKGPRTQPPLPGADANGLYEWSEAARLSSGFTSTEEDRGDGYGYRRERQSPPVPARAEVNSLSRNPTDEVLSSEIWSVGGAWVKCQLHNA